MECSICGVQLAVLEEFILDGETVCEDCYDKAPKKKRVDPWGEGFDEEAYEAFGPSSE